MFTFIPYGMQAMAAVLFDFIPYAMDGMTTVMQEIISILISAITQLGQGIGTGLTALVKAIFLQTTEQGVVSGLSVFGQVVLIFAALSLAFGLVRWVLSFITSLGSFN